MSWMGMLKVEAIYTGVAIMLIVMIDIALWIFKKWF